MENDNQNFSSYDKYLSKFEEAAEPQAVQAESLEKNPDVVDPSPIQKSLEASPKTDSQESLETESGIVPPDGIDFMSEESPAPPVSRHEKLRNEKQEGTSKGSKSVSKFDVLMMAGEMGGISNIVKAWIELLVEIRDHSKERIPKGIRVSIHRLYEVNDVFLASKTVLETLPRMDFQKALQTLEANKFSSICKMTSRNIKSQNEKMVKMCSELKETVDSADPDARTKAREMKQMVLSIHSDVEQLAHTLVNTLYGYPDENNELAVFSIIAEKGEDATHIDRAVRMIGEKVVRVADAPAMIKAMKEKDNQAMTDILERMIAN
jgi:hypothetical protein